MDSFGLWFWFGLFGFENWFEHALIFWFWWRQAAALRRWRIHCFILKQISKCPSLLFFTLFQTMAFGEGSQRLCGGGEGTISVWITGAACQLHRWDCLMMMRSTFDEDILRFWSRFKGWGVVVILKVTFCGWFSSWRSFEIFMQDLGDTMKLNLRLKSNP